jgi:hypothetical protein
MSILNIELKIIIVMIHETSKVSVGKILDRKNSGNQKNSPKNFDSAINCEVCQNFSLTGEFLGS